MKLKYFFKKWKFSQQNFFKKLRKLQKCTRKFLSKKKLETFNKKKIKTNFLLNKFLVKKIENKKIILFLYFHKLLNWLILQKNKNQAVDISKFFKIIYKYSLKDILYKKRKLKKFYKKLKLKFEFLLPLKILKFSQNLKKFEKLNSWNFVKINFFNIDKGKTLVKKLIEKATEKIKNISEISKNLAFLWWKKKLKIINFMKKKALKKFKKSAEILKKERQDKLRDLLMNRIITRQHYKLDFKMKELFVYWKIKNLNYKGKLFTKFIKNFTIKEISKKFKNKSIQKKYQHFRKALVKRNNTYMLKILAISARNFFRENKILYKIYQIGLKLSENEISVKKSFMLKWKRKSILLNFTKKVSVIQKNLKIHLRKQKFLKSFNLVKIINKITLRKIYENKKLGLDLVIKYHNDLVLYDDIEFICDLIDSYSKARFLELFERKVHENSAKILIKKLAIGKFIDGLTLAACKFYRLAKLKKLIFTAFELRDSAEDNFLRVLLRGWKLITVSEITIRKKLSIYQENVLTMHTELVDRMIDKDKNIIPRDMFNENLFEERKKKLTNYGTGNKVNENGKRVLLVKNGLDKQNQNDNYFIKNNIDQEKNKHLEGLTYLNYNDNGNNTRANQADLDFYFTNKSKKSDNYSPEKEVKLNFKGENRINNSAFVISEDKAQEKRNRKFERLNNTNVQKDNNYKLYPKSSRPANLDLSGIEKYNLESNENEYDNILNPLMDDEENDNYNDSYYANRNHSYSNARK